MKTAFVGYVDGITVLQEKRKSGSKMTSTLMLAITLLFLIPRPAVLRMRVRG
jgi:hypothetical protein